MARREPPLKRLSEQQKHGDLDRTVSGTEAQIRTAYADARASVAGTLAQFVAAYAAEQERLAAQHADEDDDRDVDGFRVPHRVPITWLHSSGWGVRVQHALSHASHAAGQQSRRYVTHGLMATRALGKQNAHDLLRLALHPAIRKGLHWRPKS